MKVPAASGTTVDPVITCVDKEEDYFIPVHPECDHPRASQINQGNQHQRQRKCLLCGSVVKLSRKQSAAADRTQGKTDGTGGLLAARRSCKAKQRLAAVKQEDNEVKQEAPPPGPSSAEEIAALTVQHTLTPVLEAVQAISQAQSQANQQFANAISETARQNQESQAALMNTVVQASNQQMSAVQGLTVAVSTLAIQGGQQGSPSMEAWSMEETILDLEAKDPNKGVTSDQ